MIFPKTALEKKIGFCHVKKATIARSTKRSIAC
jgi:hypothetical protein